MRAILSEICHLLIADPKANLKSQIEIRKLCQNLANMRVTNKDTVSLTCPNPIIPKSEPINTIIHLMAVRELRTVGLQPETKLRFSETLA